MRGPHDDWNKPSPRTVAWLKRKLKRGPKRIALGLCTDATIEVFAREGWGCVFRE